MSIPVSQREAVDSALRQLGLQADENGFDRLGEEVGVKGRTLYKVWLGNIKISERMRLALAKTGIAIPGITDESGGVQMKKCLEQVNFIYHYGSDEQIRMIEAMIQLAYQQVAERMRRAVDSSDE